MTTRIEDGAGYRWRDPWAVIPDTPLGRENGRTHGVAVSRSGHVYVFHQAVPAMLVYSPGGRLLDSWGDYPGAHGLTLVEEDGEEFLWLVDQDRPAVHKTTLSGRIVQEIPRPRPERDPELPYCPTWAAVNEPRHGGNGDIWVADGYGSHRVHRYDAEGNHLLTLDGTEGAGRFNCPHGLHFDHRRRSPELYVADRRNRRIQVYDADGRFLRAVGGDFLTSPNGCVPYGEGLLVPDLRGGLAFLDARDNLIGHLGRDEEASRSPEWPDRTPLRAHRFNSPHAAAADRHGNIFVVEWRRGGRIVRLERESAPQFYPNIRSAES